MTELNSTVKIIPKFESAYLGLVPYADSVLMQKRLAQYAKTKNIISVLGLEHPAIITLGRRADELTDLNSESTSYALPIVRSSRGGLATIHSEGQLVIYPILNLQIFNLGVRDYVKLLLETSQQLLQNFEIKAEFDLLNAGLYTESGKIAFCGIEIHQGVSQHGISINVRNDLNLFSLIRSCGVKTPKLDSLAHHQVFATMEELFQQWIQVFKKNLFKY